MHAYQIVELQIFGGRNLRVQELPLITSFNVVLKGHPDDLTLQLVLEAEGESRADIRFDLENQIKNLTLYLNLITENHINIKSGSEPQFYNEKIINVKHWQKALEALQDTNISKFMTTRHTQHDVLLQTGLNEIFNADMFNGFPKLVNWLDENDHKGASRFCKIRDVCVHGHTDDAVEKVKELFPGEFEFEDNIFRRDSSKNSTSLKKHLPELLKLIEVIFKKRIENL